VPVGSGAPLERLSVSAYRVPTDEPQESDGTIVWTGTTMVLVEASAGGATGIGYTYADAAAGRVVADSLAPAVTGMDVMSPGRIWAVMVAAVRNVGRPGVASMAISAVDVALWDLKARLLGLPLVSLLGAMRNAAPLYGSGGFTSYTESQLARQLAAWVSDGIPRVKMKIGRDPTHDPARVASARRAIGDDAELFVDANGAYVRKQALAMAQRLTEWRVSWFEEPVCYLDYEGLRLCRDHAPPTMEISVGEYGFAPPTFAALLAAGACDVLQADATRCEGITGLLVVDALCEAAMLPLSTHCAPALHLHPACALKRLRHVEYFHDHVRVERMLFDGVPLPVDGALHPDLSRPGHGLEIKRGEAERYAI
jgi:L-alanine-DL-glutamate epimerase-like enolase superfamily enzyme